MMERLVDLSDIVVNVMLLVYGLIIVPWLLWRKS